MPSHQPHPATFLLCFTLAACGGAHSTAPSSNPAAGPTSNAGGTPGGTNASSNCQETTVLCVSATAGPQQEYSTIQAAVNLTRAGDTVLVHDGSYAGFSVSRAGTASAPIVIRTAATGVVIDQANASGEGITVSNASYVTIEGFTVTGMSVYGIGTHNASSTAPMRGLTIRNNTVRNSGSANIYLSQVADSLIEGNSASGSGSSHGIYLANGGSDNTTLRANRCYGNAKNGIHLNGDLSVGGDGLHTGITIENNVLHDNVANGVDLDGIQASLIQNNVIYRNGRNAVRAFRIDAAAGPRDLRIINNTLITPAGGGWPVKLSEDGGGHVLFNNILLSLEPTTGSLSLANSSFASNNNAVVGRFSLNGEASIVDLNAWHSAGHDTASILASSDFFVDLSNGDLRLRGTAAAIDAGGGSLGGVAAPTDDIAATTRPQGAAHDIGAYESQ